VGITDSGTLAACPTKSGLSDFGLEIRGGSVVVLKGLFSDEGRILSLWTNVADGLGCVSRSGFDVDSGFFVGNLRGRESLSGWRNVGATDGDSGGGK
jgi:hypothetical protein